MIADMQRLETAARLTMGDFEGPPELSLNRQPALHALFKTGLLVTAFAAAGLLIIALF